MGQVAGQIDLFDAVLGAYSESDAPLSNKDLYTKVAQKLNLGSDVTDEKAVVDHTNIKHNLFHRKIRWVIQSLKSKNIIQSVERGFWEIKKEKKIELTAITPEHNVLSASTDLGIVIWTQNKNIFNEDLGAIDTFHAMITSPPYPLRSARAYGNPDVEAYIDFICYSIEPILPKLAAGGSIVLNVSNDIFEKGSPERSTYWMELTLALKKRLGLSYMDDVIWTSNKIPGPTQHCCIDKVQLKHGYEHCLWFTNDPKNCFANNQRVLIPNTEKYQKFIDNGGVKRASVNGDGAYVKTVGDFAKKPSKGTIPFNHLYISNTCKESREVKKYAESLNISPHSAKMPLTLAEFFVEFLTRPGDVVLDIFGGTLTTGQAAQRNGRQWVVLEMMLEYIVQGFHRFRHDSNTWFNPRLFKNNGLLTA